MTVGLNIAQAKAEFARLTASGVVGFHTHVEATEIFVVRGGDPTPFNVFSIFVAEEHGETTASKAEYLGKRIRLGSLKGWTFGIKRSLFPLAGVIQSFDALENAGEWKPSGSLLHVGPVVAAPPQFVPADATTPAAWNHVLKNNFWAGSYILELADPEKTTLQSLIDSPVTLQELSAAIAERVPISIASLSDRLGNLIFQIPASIIVTRFGRDRVSGDATVNLAWHPKAIPRALRATCGMEFDNVVVGYASAEIRGGTSMVLPMADGPGMLRGTIWDDLNGLVLAATGKTAFIRRIGLTMHAIDPEPRVFILKDTSGNNQSIRVALSRGSPTTIGPVIDDRMEDWTRRRIYRDEAARLAAEKIFVQYRPRVGPFDQHERALEDVRTLINRYGEYGAWLWDPYLNADDVLRTLFYCVHASAPLRALTAAQAIPPPRRVTAGAKVSARLAACIKTTLASLSKSRTPQYSFADAQRDVFRAANSNLRGLNLEFRMKVGPAGWAFHDRFLIFPQRNGGALAWSLGTSVNSMGRQHHILQRVDDGQLIADAFDELWNVLDQPEHLIWKAP
ncbi:MAG: hypothetical protein EPN45_09315 [Rhizobiaceae bacterium]|nr:MAG: hypothetical protein EPN45_09315 [Rhizobiaceae bacterium]